VKRLRYKGSIYEVLVLGVGILRRGEEFDAPEEIAASLLSQEENYEEARAPGPPPEKRKGGGR
jgi:hypothetical protein